MKKRKIFLILCLLWMWRIHLYGQEGEMVENILKKEIKNREAIESNDKDDNSMKFEKSSFWKKLTYTIGYSGGICWTGKHLQIENPAPLDPTAILYWLNLIEGSIIYLLNNKVKIEAGGGYVWWPLLTKRNGLYLYIPNKDPETGYAYVVTGEKWRISGAEIFLKTNIRTFFMGISLYFCKASTVESLFFTFKRVLSFKYYCSC